MQGCLHAAMLYIEGRRILTLITSISIYYLYYSCSRSSINCISSSGSTIRVMDWVHGVQVSVAQSIGIGAGHEVRRPDQEKHRLQQPEQAEIIE